MGNKGLFKGFTPYLFVAPAVLVLAFTCLYPVIKGFELSFYDWSLGTPIESRKYIGWENFAWAWQDPALFNSIKVTLIFAAFAVTAELFLGLLIAFLLEKGIKGIAVLRTVFIIPIMIAPVVVGLLWRYLFDANFGLINHVVSLFGFKPIVWLGTPGLALPAVIITDIWQWTPFVILILLAGLLALPEEPFEAAKIDGASALQSFWHITIPMLSPLIYTAMLFRFIDAFKAFDIIWVMTGGGPGRATTTLNIFAFRTGFEFLHMGTAAAIAILMLILAITVSTALLRRSTVNQ